MSSTTLSPTVGQPDRFPTAFFMILEKGREREKKTIYFNVPYLATLAGKWTSKNPYQENGTAQPFPIHCLSKFSPPIRAHPEPRLWLLQKQWCHINTAFETQEDTGLNCLFCPAAGRSKMSYLTSESFPILAQTQKPPQDQTREQPLGDCLSG